MDWADEENRIVVITPHKCEMEKIAIFKTLKPFGISSMFVYRAIKLFDDTGDVKGRERSERARIVKKYVNEKSYPVKWEYRKIQCLACSTKTNNLQKT